MACSLFFSCFDHYVTPMSYHQDHHRRSLSVALLVMDVLVQQRAPVAYAHTIAIWRYFLPSVDQSWGAGQATSLREGGVRALFGSVDAVPGWEGVAWIWGIPGTPCNGQAEQGQQAEDP